MTTGLSSLALRLRPANADRRGHGGSKFTDVASQFSLGNRNSMTWLRLFERHDAHLEIAGDNEFLSDQLDLAGLGVGTHFELSLSESRQPLHNGFLRCLSFQYAEAPQPVDIITTMRAFLSDELTRCNYPQVDQILGQFYDAESSDDSSGRASAEADLWLHAASDPTGSGASDLSLADCPAAKECGYPDVDGVLFVGFGLLICGRINVVCPTAEEQQAWLFSRVVFLPK